MKGKILVSKAYVSKIGNNNRIKEVEEILNFPDYIFEIDGKDISDAKITYYYDSIENVEFIDGKREKEFSSPLIYLEISGVDDNNKTAFLSFMLKLDLEILNNFDKNKIEDITIYILESESFVKRPNEDKSRFLDYYLPTNKHSDMFHQLTSLYVLKLDDDKFLFKLTIPNENIFTYFEVNFKH